MSREGDTKNKGNKVQSDLLQSKKLIGLPFAGRYIWRYGVCSGSSMLTLTSKDEKAAKYPFIHNFIVSQFLYLWCVCSQPALFTQRSRNIAATKTRLHAAFIYLHWAKRRRVILVGMLPFCKQIRRQCLSMTFHKHVRASKQWNKTTTVAVMRR